MNYVGNSNHSGPSGYPSSVSLSYHHHLAQQRALHDLEVQYHNQRRQIYNEYLNRCRLVLDTNNLPDYVLDSNTTVVESRHFPPETRPDSRLDEIAMGQLNSQNMASIPGYYSEDYFDTSRAREAVYETEEERKKRLTVEKRKNTIKLKKQYMRKVTDIVVRDEFYGKAASHPGVEGLDFIKEALELDDKKLDKIKVKDLPKKYEEAQEKVTVGQMKKLMGKHEPGFFASLWYNFVNSLKKNLD